MIMIQKIKTILYLSGIAAMLVSCDSMLDLAPEDTIVEDQVFEKFATAEATVAGTYHLLFQAATSDYMLADITSSACNYTTQTAKTYDPINFGSIDTDNGMVQGIYESYYVALVQANLVIAKIADLGKYDELQMRKHIAEAKFIRAFAYLRLLGWFGDGALSGKTSGDGVVLYLDYYDGFDRSKDVRPRETNAEVFAQIILDLEEAYADLPLSAEVTEMETRVARANQTSCDALLARTYLYKGDYAMAAQMANRVLSKTEFSLESNLLTVFPVYTGTGAAAFSKEHLFGFPVSSNGGNWQFGGNGINYVYNTIWFRPDFLATFSETDLRRTQLMHTSVLLGTTETHYVTSKYQNGSQRDNMTMIRLAEILLTKAEALSHTESSVSSEMLSALNAVYRRSNPTAAAYVAADFANVEAFRATVLAERKKELAFEGLERFDELRTGVPLYTEELPENKRVLPIPRREVDISNGVVKQNEGYLIN